MIAEILVALISPTVAVGITVWGFRRTSQADRLRAFFEVQERYLEAEVRQGRRLVYQWVAGRKSSELSALPPEVRSQIGYALAVMNSIAIACDGKYVDVQLIARSMGKSYREAILAAAPYIDYLEKQRGFRPYGFAERLASQLRTGHQQEPSVMVKASPVQSELP